MKVQKITGKVKLGEENVEAEGNYTCLHDCIDYKYTGKTAEERHRSQLNTPEYCNT